jgi:hypothetical protein
MPRRTIREMIEDYEALLPAPLAEERAYFCPDSRPSRTGMGAATAQVFWRTAEQTHTEARSVSLGFEAKPVRQTLRFPIPAEDGPPVELRFDPASHSGLVLLHSMRIVDSRGGVAREWLEDPAAIQALSRSEIAVLGMPAAKRGVLLYLRDSDPHLILPVSARGEGLRGGGTLEVAFTWLSSSGLPQALIASIRLGEIPLLSPAECDELIGQPGGIPPIAVPGVVGRESPDRLQRELALARARVTDLENSLTWRASAPLRAIAGRVLRLSRGVNGKRR